MKRAWLYLVPLIYLPSLGGPWITDLGYFRLGDLLLIPLIVTLLFNAQPSPKSYSGQIVPLLLAFLAFASVSVFSIPERYSYPIDSPILQSAASLLWTTVYAFAGITLSRCIKDDVDRRAMLASITMTGLVLGLSFTIADGDIPTLREWYGNTNGYSVVMSMIFCFLVAIWLDARGRGGFEKWIPFVLPVLAYGILLSNGRGGWLAAFAGFAYLVFRRGPRGKLMVPAWVATLALPALYQFVPNFRREIDRTFFPERAAEFGYTGSRNVGTIDDGLRLELWTSEISKWVNAPFLGTGYTHKGGQSGIDPLGSHNFFIQILLETGMPAFLLLLAVIVIVWRQAGRIKAHDPTLELSVKTMTVVAIVGAMGGEYFYTGSLLFAFFMLYSPLGSIRRDSRMVTGPEIVRPNLWSGWGLQRTTGDVAEPQLPSSRHETV